VNAAAFFAGRLMFGGFFFYNGINHFRNRKSMAQYAGAKNIPMPEAAVVASGAVLLFGGASVTLRWKPKLGAAAIIALSQDRFAHYARFLEHRRSQPAHENEMINSPGRAAHRQPEDRLQQKHGAARRCPRLVGSGRALAA
jgi:hypothetical protein